MHDLPDPYAFRPLAHSADMSLTEPNASTQNGRRAHRHARGRGKQQILTMTLAMTIPHSNDNRADHFVEKTCSAVHVTLRSTPRSVAKRPV
jgi:hypothetical protein